MENVEVYLNKTRRNQRDFFKNMFLLCPDGVIAVNRSGGDEFFILLPETVLESAEKTAEKICLLKHFGHTV